MYTDVLSNMVITGVHSVSTLFTIEKAKMRRPNRSRWAIVVKYEGETVYMCNEKLFISDINHIVILPKGCSYDWECTRSGHFSIIEFDSNATYYEPISFHVKNAEKVLHIFKDMEYKRSLKKPMFEVESIRDTYSVILMLAKLNSEKYTSGSKRKKLQPALEYISQHFKESITNDVLAGTAGMSTVYFRKLFTEVMGVSPITYAKQLRIEKAKEMLKSDYGTLTDVAQSLGYSSLYDFSRDFKKHTGTAPSKY